MLVNEMFEIMKKMEQAIDEREDEIKRLNKKIELLEGYLDIYEEYIKGVEKEWLQ